MPVDLPGIEGFMPGRATLIVDLINLALIPVLIVLTWSLFEARTKKNFALHKKLMITITAVLAVAIVVFETDIRLNGWQKRAEYSRFWREEGGLLWSVLYIHLFFSLTTVVLWSTVLVRALRNFPSPPRPDKHSRWHKRWARLAAIDMYLTVFTGWTFYVVAFIA